MWHSIPWMVSLMQTLVYVSGIWQGFLLKQGIKKTCLTLRLHYMLQNKNIGLMWLFLEKRIIIFTLATCNMKRASQLFQFWHLKRQWSTWIFCNCQWLNETICDPIQLPKVDIEEFEVSIHYKHTNLGCCSTYIKENLQIQIYHGGRFEYFPHRHMTIA